VGQGVDEYGYSWLHIANEQPPPRPARTDGHVDEDAHSIDGDPAGLDTYGRETTDELVREQRDSALSRTSDSVAKPGGFERDPSPVPDVRVIGPVEVSWREVPERRVVAELACLLAMHPNRNVTSEEARAALWPGDPEVTDASAKSLRNAVSLLRRALGPELVPGASKGRGYRLAPEVTCDWVIFEALVEKSRNAPNRNDELELLTEALALVRGSPFQGVEPGTFAWAWTELFVARIEVAVVGAAHRLSDIGIALGDAEQASWAALQGLACSPYDRQLWSDLLEASARQGRGALDRSWRHATAVLGDDASALEMLMQQLKAVAP
jgi:DNA-binding SARP family transcriptional activator